LPKEASIPQPSLKKKAEPTVTKKKPVAAKKVFAKKAVKKMKKAQVKFTVGASGPNK
jgi:hypothetical protein